MPIAYNGNKRDDAPPEEDLDGDNNKSCQSEYDGIRAPVLILASETAYNGNKRDDTPPEDVDGDNNKSCT